MTEVLDVNLNRRHVSVARAVWQIGRSLCTIEPSQGNWFTGLNQKADEAGFIAVYPNGTGSGFRYFWNGGDCCGSAVQEQVDDVAFIRALLDNLAHKYRVDPSRIVVTGLSNGAIMAYRLASELSDRIFVRGGQQVD